MQNAVLDVFNLLRRYPAHFFGQPGADHTQKITSLLCAQYVGSSQKQAKRQQCIAGGCVSAAVRSSDGSRGRASLVHYEHHDEHAAFNRASRDV